MTSTRTETPTADGAMPGHLWLPESGRGPGLLLLQEIFGVSAYIQRRGADLAALGYVVLAPELYWRLERQALDEGSDGAIEQAMGLVGQLDPDTTLGECRAALTDLGGRTEVEGTPGVIGFCFGGGLAWAVASQADPSLLVAYYGSSIPDALDLAPSVTCPGLHHVGTADSYLDAAVIADAAARSGTPGRVETYEGADHAFDNDDFGLYHPEASAAAWDTTVAFLREHLPA